MRCPICKKEVREPAEGEEIPSYFPFCSERCKNMDLGAWASESFRVPEDSDPAEPDDETTR